MKKILFVLLVAPAVYGQYQPSIMTGRLTLRGELPTIAKPLIQYTGTPGPFPSDFYWVLPEFASGDGTLSQPVRYYGISSLSGSNYITISWLPVPSAIRYHVYRTSTPTFTTTNTLIVSTTATSITDTGLASVTRNLSPATSIVYADIRGSAAYRLPSVFVDPDTTGVIARMWNAGGDGYVNIMAYGARGDNATDDTDALLAAMSTGLPVMMPAGNFVIRNGTVLTVPLKGAGSAHTSIVITGNGTFGLQTSRSIQGVTIDASAVTLTNAALILRDSVNERFEDIRTFGGVYGIRLDENVKFSKFYNVRTVNASTAGFAIVEPAGGWVSADGTGECRIENLSIDGSSTQYGFFLSRTTSIDYGAWFITYLSAASQSVNSMRLVSTVADTWAGIFCHLCVLDASGSSAIYAENVTDIRFLGGWAFPSGTNLAPFYLKNVKHFQAQNAHIASLNGPMLRIEGTSNSNILLTGNYLRGDTSVGIVDILSGSSATDVVISFNQGGAKPMAYAGAETRVLNAANSGWKQSTPMRIVTGQLGGSAALSIQDLIGSDSTYIRQGGGGLEYVNNAFSAVIGKLYGNGAYQFFVTSVSGLPVCNSTIRGSVAVATDSNTNTWGATIGGGGSYQVLAFCNGSNWTVAGR